MSLEVKVFVTLAPVFFVAMVYALTQGNWQSAVVLAILEVLIFRIYRLEKRSQSPTSPEHRSDV